MAWGFFKKLVIADRIGAHADAVFIHPDMLVCYRYGWQYFSLAFRYMPIFLAILILP